MHRLRSGARLVLCLSLGACLSPPHEGTAVGNPTGLTVEAAPGDALSFTSGEAMVDSISITACAGGTVGVFPLEHPVDLLGGEVIELALADSCRVQITFGGPLEFAGMGPGQTRFILALSVPALDLVPAASADSSARMILQLASPGWISAHALGLPQQESASVEAGSALHDTLMAAILAGSGLYVDPDGDGHCSESECAVRADGDGAEGDTASDEDENAEEKDPGRRGCDASDTGDEGT